MVGAEWIVRWNEYSSDTYLYGSEITYNKNSVHFHNDLMPPGIIIKKWYSKVNFQMNKIEPALPIIDGEGKYSLVANIDCPEGQEYLLKLVYFDRYGNEVGSQIIRDKEVEFQCPIKTYSYELQLIGVGVRDIMFSSIVIRELIEDGES